MHKTIIIGCSKSKELAKKIAKKLKVKYSELIVKKFPDNETYVKYKIDLRNKVVVLVQSFYDVINDDLIETIFASYTAKDLGAKKVILVAPYFPYLRQDKRFTPGEAISIHIIGDLADHFWDEIYIIDPHLHREKTLQQIFKIKAHKLTADPLIAEYIKKNIKNALIIGPDVESYRWAKKTAEIIGCESAILKKERFSARKVEVSLNKKINIKDKNIVIVDDIISTGHTLLKTIKLLKRLGAKRITCICVHGIFAENALPKLKKTGAKIISTNTIPNVTSRIDVSSLIVDVLNKKY